MEFLSLRELVRVVFAFCVAIFSVFLFAPFRKFKYLVKDMLKYEITFRVSLCSTCMHAGDGCETPHDDSFEPK